VNGVDVLFLHGSPGSGKTTQARALAELLREAGLANALIDPDDFSIICPFPGKSFSYDNIAAVWPNYTAIANPLKVVIPTVFDDEEDMGRLRAIVPAETFMVCELTAPIAILKERVTAREPTELWKSHLRGLVDLYHQRTDLPRIVDFEVSTDDRSVDDTAREVLDRSGWIPGVVGG
jgi:adenylylsulfate kinase-like enzyme